MYGKVFFVSLGHFYNTFVLKGYEATNVEQNNNFCFKFVGIIGPDGT